MAICEICGTENRDKARFCRGCARPLVALPTPAVSKPPRKSTPDLFPDQACRCISCGAFNAPGATACMACGKALPTGPALKTDEKMSGVARRPALWRWVVVVAVGVAALAFGVRQWQAPISALPDNALQASPAPDPIAPPPSMAKESFVEPSYSEVIQEAEVTRENELRRPEQIEPTKPLNERLTQRERQNSASALQHQSVVEASQTAEKSGSPVPGASSESLAPPVASPKPEISVEIACSQSSNVILRDVCRIEACRKPSKAADPICVWYRKLEAERRSKITF